MTIIKTPVFVDLDNTIVDFDGAKARMIELNPKQLYPQSQLGFFSDLKPLPEAVESIQLLLKSKNYEPWILTAPSIKNPLSYTEKRLSVERLFGIDMVKRLIISPDKSFFYGTLIDDNIKGSGQESFDGDVIHFGSDEYPNWISVINFLRPVV